MSEYIYRVVVRTTGSLQPSGGGTYWSRQVVYCGPSLRDARVAYLREEAADYGGSHGNRARETLIQQFAAEPDDIVAADRRADPVRPPRTGRPGEREGGVAMAGKPMGFASVALAWTLDGLSKNTLADIVVDRARQQVGREDATDEELVAVIQGWLSPVAIVRRDKPLNLAARYAECLASSERYISQQEAHRVAAAGKAV